MLTQCLSGGPGHSGIDFVNAQSASFRQIYGPGYDLIGFDPRCALVKTLSIITNV
jgi:hypothetical protein